MQIYSYAISTAEATRANGHAKNRLVITRGYMKSRESFHLDVSTLLNCFLGGVSSDFETKAAVLY